MQVASPERVREAIMDQTIAEVDLQEDTDLGKLMRDQISRCQPIVNTSLLTGYSTPLVEDISGGLC